MSFEPKGRRRLLTSLAVMAAAALPVLWGFNRLVPRPTGLGATDGRLRGCPDSPNCVGSQAEDPAHRVAPLTFAGTGPEAWARLQRVLEDLPGATQITASDRYLHYEFRTRVCRFVDDVEFLLDEPARAIHVRSASRVGYSDLGANRRRIEEIRRRFEESRGG